MKKPVAASLLAVLGVICTIAALLVPAHLRALDASVVEGPPAAASSVIEAGLSSVHLERIGPASLLLQAAKQQNLAEHEKLDLAIQQFESANPELLAWGGADPYLENLFGTNAPAPQQASTPVLDLLVQANVRERVLQFLLSSRRPGVQAILENRDIEDTAVFPPAKSPSGQALESTLLLAALLFQGDHFTTSIRNHVQALAFQANRDQKLIGAERFYYDLMSLGKRLNWVQLAKFIENIERVSTFHSLANITRGYEERLPLIASAVYLSGNPDEVARYTTRFGEDGIMNLGFSLRGGTEALNRVLHSQLPVHYATLRDRVVGYDPFGAFFYAILESCRSNPTFALILKYSFFLLSGFLLAQCFEHARRPLSQLEQSLRVRGISLARQGLFSISFLGLAIFLGEPYLTQDSKPIEFPLQIRFPMLAVAESISNQLQPVMDQITIVTLLAFLVLQGIIYVLCLIKIAEIRRQPIESDVKLKLLENEENMFDAGLYCGLGGTVGSLVILALGIIKPSLVAAYSSTLFGIIFVAIFKICHLRPLRRKLILDRELQNA